MDPLTYLVDPRHRRRQADADRPPGDVERLGVEGTLERWSVHDGDLQRCGQAGSGPQQTVVERPEERAHRVGVDVHPGGFVNRPAMPA